MCADFQKRDERASMKKLFFVLVFGVFLGISTWTYPQARPIHIRDDVSAFDLLLTLEEFPEGYWCVYNNCIPQGREASMTYSSIDLTRSDTVMLTITHYVYERSAKKFFLRRSSVDFSFLNRESAHWYRSPYADEYEMGCGLSRYYPECRAIGRYGNYLVEFYFEADSQGYGMERSFVEQILRASDERIKQQLVIHDQSLPLSATIPQASPGSAITQTPQTLPASSDLLFQGSAVPEGWVRESCEPQCEILETERYAVRTIEEPQSQTFLRETIFRLDTISLAKEKFSSLRGRRFNWLASPPVDTPMAHSSAVSEWYAYCGRNIDASPWICFVIARYEHYVVVLKHQQPASVNTPIDTILFANVVQEVDEIMQEALSTPTK